MGACIRGLDVLDLQHGDALAVTILAAMILAALLLEDDDLFGAILTENFSRHAGTLHNGRTHGDLAGIANHQNVVERQGCPFFAFQLLNENHVA